MNYRDILRWLLGRDSGWRVRELHSTFKVDLMSTLSAETIEGRLGNPNGMHHTLRLRQIGAAIPFSIENEGIETARNLMPGLVNKILTGPHGGSVHEEHLDELYGALSLGLSTRSEQNLTLVWFGNVGTIVSALTVHLPPISVAAQIGLASAVAVLPFGSNVVHLSKGSASVIG